MPRALALLALLAWLIILSPYPATMFFAGATACLTLPVFRWLRARMGRVTSISIYSVGLVACLMIPFTVVTIMLAPEIMAGVRELAHWQASGWPMPPLVTEYLDQLESWLIKIPGFTTWRDEMMMSFDDIQNTVMRTLLSGGIGMAGSAVSAVWTLVLFVVFSVLGVLYAPTLAKLTLRVTRLPEDSLQRFVRAIRAALRAVALGMLLVALVQGVLCGIGFTITGVSNPIFWGLLAVFAAVIPVVGTALVWVPMALVLWVMGSPYAAVGLILWCVILVAGSDNLIRPYMLRTGIKAPLVVLLLSILCSIAVFGPAGLIAGPVLVAFGMQAMEESDILQARQQR